MHSYKKGQACSACGDLDGCHIPGKVGRHRELKRLRYMDDGGCGDQECEMKYLPVPKTEATEARYGQSFPRVVCLCGSTRFGDAYSEAMKNETLEGNIVLTVGLLGHAEGLDMDGPLKEVLDQLHLRKIDLSDEVLVLNVGGYVGKSTAGEIRYARRVGRRVRWLEPDNVPEEFDES